MNVAAIVIGLCAGVAAALVYLLMLWLSVAAAIRRRSATPLILGTVARLGLFVLLGAVLWWLRPEPTSLIAGALGFLVTRTVVIRRVPSLPDGAFSKDA
ncbi:ATP synthase subunit I [Dichotomicrobium thermohalophilum]|uniref:F1-F0 ATPase (N-ATPase) AtpR subunit n=1 Tax=Dichotomicrobium thermohalophilum TaxID=933063 RepID=A0A397Q1M3_9HYPH|nr:ATP synthase subunit I [Dichotomicrobium thermohalophilum]RIA55072.1 F1-F0 ATPase (N-ATPase) AtpR subunit [Dichotomicrobium thermohalophilum]